MNSQCCCGSYSAQKSCCRSRICMVTCGFPWGRIKIWRCFELCSRSTFLDVLGTSLTSTQIQRRSVSGTWGKRNVFEAVASGGVGDLLCYTVGRQHHPKRPTVYSTMNLAFKKSDVFIFSMVWIVIDLCNKGCDDLRQRFCFEMFGGHFIVRIDWTKLSTCGGDTQQTLKPFVVQCYSAK